MARPLAHLLGTLALAASVGGCPTNNGIDPPGDRLFFPIAAALHRPPAGGPADYLYVINADFDLAYNGSTVAAVDLARVRQRLRDHAGCRADPTARDAWLCDDAPLVKAEYTRKLNPYAVEAALGAYPGSSAQRLYVLVRGGNAMAWFDVRPDGSLDCGAPDENGYCAADHSAGADPAQSPTGARLPQDPSSLSVDPECGWVVVTHQNTDSGGPRASLFRDPAALAAPGGPAQPLRPVLLNVVSGIAPGLSALALLPRAPFAPTPMVPTREDYCRGQRSTWLATSRAEASFTMLQVYPGTASLADNRAFLYRAAASPVTGLNTGADSRAIALDPADPRRAYVTSRRPEALLTLDVTNPASPSVVDAIPLPPGPSRLAAVRNRALDRTLVYAVGYDSRWIYVVDPAEHRVVGQIPTNRGPHALVHDDVEDYLYVVDFLDSAVEVIDVSPTVRESVGDNPMYNRRVLTFGRPGRPGVTQ